MKSETPIPQHPLPPFSAEHTDGRPELSSVSVCLWRPATLRSRPSGAGIGNPPLLTLCSAAHEHTCSLAPNPAEAHRGNGLLLLKGKKAGPCSHPCLAEPRAEGKCLQSSSWVRGRHGTPVPRSPGSGQHKQRLCSAACLLRSRRSCGQRGAVRTIQDPSMGLLLHSQHTNKHCWQPEAFTCPS